ncbi:hypothetical protein OIU78_014117 [Salix suchowensis]|nr:hypothetical protein OIU78_014117 [Salix suchowensis]
MELQVSDLEETQLFYFQARGIDLETARKALVYSSGAEVIEKLPFSFIRKQVEKMFANSCFGRVINRTAEYISGLYQVAGNALFGVSCLQTMRRDVVLPSKCKIIADFFRCFKAVTVMNYGVYPNCSR